MLDELPQAGEEFLGLDVMAFDHGDDHGTSVWRFPVAVFELENSSSDDRVAYSLWKALCVRASLRVVFAYRPDWDAGIELVQRLGHDVVGAMKIRCPHYALDGNTLVVLGCRGEGDTFPHGYFKIWRLNTNTGRFDKL